MFYNFFIYSNLCKILSVKKFWAILKFWAAHFPWNIPYIYIYIIYRSLWICYFIKYWFIYLNLLEINWEYIYVIIFEVVEVEV